MECILSWGYGLWLIYLHSQFWKNFSTSLISSQNIHKSRNTLKETTAAVKFTKIKEYAQDFDNPSRQRFNFDENNMLYHPNQKDLFLNNDDSDTGTDLTETNNQSTQ